MPSPKAALTSAREKRPALDHLIRAVGRYQADAGDRQAAAVTFFGFLSFFPVLALATAILTYALGDDAVSTVVREVNAYAPGLADQLGLRDLLSNNAAAAGTGVVGLAGLLYSGLGWVDALREAVRTIWHHNVLEGNIVVKKLKDVVVLAGLGATLVLSVGVSAATGAFTGFALGLVGLEESFVATALAKVVGVVLGLATSTALFLYLFWRLPKVQSPLRRVLRGALLAGVLFEVLKRVGAFYIERTTENPLYGTFAVIVGLLVWINIVSRVFLICAAWTVTAPYDSDVEPSGTASLRAAKEAGVPAEFVDEGAEDPLNVQEDGAPSPLVGALQAKPGARGDRERPPAGESGRTQPAGAAAAAGGGVAVLDRPTGMASPDGPPEGAKLAARSAATFLSGALGAVLVGVLLHVGKTVKGLVRR